MDKLIDYSIKVLVADDFATIRKIPHHRPGRSELCRLRHAQGGHRREAAQRILPLSRIFDELLRILSQQPC